MTGDRAERTVSVELTADELTLVRAALVLLLEAEDDTETIDQLKVLIARLEPIR
jgi:hypothetical protein